MAALPIVAPKAWENRGFQALITVACALPVVVYCATAGRMVPLTDAAKSYFSFVSTIGALYVVASGIHISGDLRATPRVNVTFVVVGALLASIVGTTGA